MPTRLSHFACIILQHLSQNDTLSVNEQAPNEEFLRAPSPLPFGGFLVFVVLPGGHLRNFLSRQNHGRFSVFD
jgi:hypothetical protein